MKNILANRLTRSSLSVVMGMLAVLFMGSMGTALASNTPSPIVSVQSGSTGVDVGTIVYNSDATVVIGATNQNITVKLPITVTDLSGLQTGWHITIAATTFAGPSTHTLGSANLAASGIATPTRVGDGTYTDPTWGTNMSDGTVLPTDVASTLLDSTSSSGMGVFLVNTTFTVSLPANAYKADYTSTVTLAYIQGA